MALRTASQCNDSVTIDINNLAQIEKHKTSLDNSMFWHKFIIEDVYGLRRNVVLKIIFDSIKSLDFIPLCYMEQGKGAFFFARICRHVIEKFCNDKLIIQNPLNSENSFKMKIILKYTNTKLVKVDLSENVLSVLQKRLKSQVLSLNNFAEDPDLTEFYLLSQPRLLAFVLNVAKNLNFKAIKLCNNEITTLDAFKVFSLHNIVFLDLRQNMIKDLAELKYLEQFDITELWLEGNPLCGLYDEYSYVQQVIKYCPKIEKLDGFLLRQNGVPSFRRNFVCNISSHDVVDQFLEHYFPTYDARNLIKLHNFYHKDALFSLTAEFFPAQMSSSHTEIEIYKPYSRNLLTTSTNIKNLFLGSNSIMLLFSVLPRSEHDPYSFTVDVLHYTKKCVIIVVSGVFREVPHLERIFGFNRYFVLECLDDVYKIANEQMHVFNALTSQQLSAFKKTTALPEPRNLDQKNQMVNTFSLITNLTKDWAKLFLEECQYNLKHAIMVFVDLYKYDKVPLSGFKNLN